MYVMDTFTGDEARVKAVNTAPFGPGFSQEEADKAEKLVVRASTASEPAEYTLWQLFDADGNPLGMPKRINGF